MSKKIFSLAVVSLLVAIFIINIFQNQKDKEEMYSETSNQYNPEAESQKKYSSEKIVEGSMAPDFTLTTLDGQTVSLSDYRGKKVIINFWATWCPPCRAEMPHMQNFYTDSAEMENVEILAVNVTDLDKGEEAINKFVSEYKLTFPILLDKKGDVSGRYQAVAFPTSYIIDTQGKVSKRIVGPMNEEMMMDLVKGAS
ncbi:peroxiredoxin family protein [Rossellomorea sp. BNER]|uniref:peroxiredoxin family protein n=1 Tax=Rossellomorea sp. BNER TaxID=2962031 RepID=UPI003AF21651|nr:TlpA family protein disulfide reductase [Rossellomorea sp. BNER]